MSAYFFLYFLSALEPIWRWGVALFEGVGWELELVRGTRRQYCSGLMLNKCLIKPALHGVQHKCLINVGLRTNKSDKQRPYTPGMGHIILLILGDHILSEFTSETTLGEYFRNLLEPTSSGNGALLWRHNTYYITLIYMIL